MSAPQAVVTIDENLIREIVRRVLSVAKPDKIILFGSAATGQMTPDSDIDLLVVESVIADHDGEYVRIRRALGNLGFPFDILFITTEWFDASKNVIGGIAYPAHHYGKVVYDAP